MWDQMKTANAIKAVWSEEMGLKKTSKVFEVPRGHSKTKLTARNRYRETDQNVTCLETSVALQS